MNNYEAKQAARKERYEELADKNRAKANQEFRKGDLREEVSGIPMGQPILIGHHSEQRHRNAIERANNAMRRGIETEKKAAYYADKADGVGRGGISSDDPDAPDKIQARITKLEAKQTYMRNANKAMRAAYKGGYRETGTAEELLKVASALQKATGREHTEAEARAILTPDFCGRRGFADYALTNNNANIRRLKKRLETLESAQIAEHKETETNGVKVVENVEENRIQLFFPGKPADEVRANLKSRGFRWSRYNGCWQRHLNNAGRYAAECVVKSLV